MSPVALQVNFQEVCCGLPVPDVALMETSPFWVHSPPLLKPIPVTSVICKLRMSAKAAPSSSFPFSWLLPPIALPVPDVAQMDTFPFCVKSPPLLQSTPECKAPWLVDHSQLLPRGRYSYIRGISTIRTCMLECKRTVHHQWGCDIQPHHPYLAVDLYLPASPRETAPTQVNCGSRRKEGFALTGVQTTPRRTQ